MRNEDPPGKNNISHEINEAMMKPENELLTGRKSPQKSVDEEIGVLERGRSISPR